MDAMQIVVPVAGIIAAAAATFYVVSFSEIREKSFRELDDEDDNDNGFQSTMSSRERRARRKADKRSNSR